jgi:hypothetical protein
MLEVLGMLQDGRVKAASRRRRSEWEIRQGGVTG